MSTRNPTISKGVDWSLVWIWFILCAIGITSIFAASYHDGDNVVQGFIGLKTDYSRQLLFFLLSGIIGTFAIGQRRDARDGEAIVVGAHRFAAGLPPVELETGGLLHAECHGRGRRKLPVIRHEGRQGRVSLLARPRRLDDQKGSLLS